MRAVIGGNNAHTPKAAHQRCTGSVPRDTAASAARGTAYLLPLLPSDVPAGSRDDKCKPLATGIPQQTRFQEALPLTGSLFLPCAEDDGRAIKGRKIAPAAAA